MCVHFIPIVGQHASVLEESNQLCHTNEGNMHIKLKGYLILAGLWLGI